MGDEIELISDGDGLAVIGETTAVARFLRSSGLARLAQNLDLHRLAPSLRVASQVSRAASGTSAQSARWVKLTPESAQIIKSFGLVKTPTPGISYAMAGKPGSIKSWIQIETGPGALMNNPAVLSGVAGVMDQLARQHEMSEIRDYLASLGTKLDDVKRGQTDAQVAKLMGARMDIESAMAIRARQGRVDDDTWSTVQARNNTISDAIGWALRRFDALAGRLESTTKIGALGETTAEVEPEALELLAVVAHCFELQDQLDVLRLDRVLDASQKELDARRLALRADREKWRGYVLEGIASLIGQLDAAAGRAHANVLLHGASHRAAVSSRNGVVVAVDAFQRPLGLESGRAPLEATRWRDAARNLRQLTTAGKEAGGKSLKVIGGVGAAVLVTAAAAAVAQKAKEEFRKEG